MPHKRKPSTVNINRNVNWLNYSGVWAWYITIIVLSWLIGSAWIDDAGLAWTYVHLVHGVVSYYLLHWVKGSPITDDQGKYESLTFWEQIDGEVYSTRNRKIFTAAPVILFLLATHGTDFRKQPLGANLVVVLVLLVAKLPSMHKVRIFGINKW